MKSLAEWNSSAPAPIASASVLDRFVAILDGVKETGRPTSITELALRTGIPKSTVSRLVAEMVDRRYLQRDEGRVSLGMRLFEFGTRAVVPRRLLAAAAPVIRSLHGATGERVGLWVQQGTDMVSIAAVAGRLPMLPTCAGMRAPALTTASGKAYLAFCDDEGVVKRVSALLVEPAAGMFLDELEHVRDEVVAVDRESSYPGILAVASPVLSADRTVIGAISIAGPSGSMDPDRVTPLIRGAGSAVTRPSFGGMTTVRTGGWTESISMLDRITAVFEAVGATEGGLGITELARRANLPKSTVSRIAANLVDQRLLDREGDRLYLGVRLFEFGQTVERPRKLRVLAHPVMAELRNVTGLVVYLALLEDRHVVLISVLGGRSGTPPLAMVGSRFPAHATALGKALLAFPSSDGSARHVLEGGLRRRTPHTICDPAELVRELREVRHSGVAFEREECLIGRACVGGAILSLGAVAVAAICVAGTPAEVAHDRVVPAVRSAAKTLGHRLDLHRDL